MKRAIPAFLLALLAFICFILVTVTSPFVKSLYLVSIKSVKDNSLGLNLGVFGTCYPGRATVLGITVSHQACSSPKYPYELDPAFFGWNTTSGSNLNPFSDKFLSNDVLGLVKDVGKALILNPISAAFALLAFIPSLISICTTWRFTQILAWILLLLATICSWIAFIVNIVFAAVTKNRVKNQTNGNYVAKYGNAIWISLAGAILMTIAMVMALFGSCCCVKRRKEEEPVPVHDVEADAVNRETSVDTAEKVHGDGTVPVHDAPKKRFSVPWGKKSTPVATEAEYAAHHEPAAVAHEIKH